MEILWFLIDNWPLVLAVSVFCYLMVRFAEVDVNGVGKAFKKSEKLRKEVEDELDKRE